MAVHSTPIGHFSFFFSLFLSPVAWLFLLDGLIIDRSVSYDAFVPKVRDNYLDDSLEDLAFDLDIALPDLIQACASQK